MCVIVRKQPGPGKCLDHFRSSQAFYVKYFNRAIKGPHFQKYNIEDFDCNVENLTKSNPLYDEVKRSTFKLKKLCAAIVVYLIL